MADDGHADRPPRRCSAPEEEILGRIDLFFKNVTELEITDHIDKQNRPIQRPEISQAIALSELLA